MLMVISMRIRIGYGRDSYCAKTVGRSRLDRHIKVSVAKVMVRMSRRRCHDVDRHFQQSGARNIIGQPSVSGR